MAQTGYCTQQGCILMDERDQLLVLIQCLYAAPGGSDGWHDFLLDLRISFDGTAASFVSHNFVSQEGNVSVSVGARSGSRKRLYQRHWCSPRSVGLQSDDSNTGFRERRTWETELVTHADMRRTALLQRLRAASTTLCAASSGMIEVERHAVSVLVREQERERGESFGPARGGASQRA